MSRLFAYGKVKPKLEYYGLPFEKAVGILDWYVSNYDSYEFRNAGVSEMFFIHIEADMDEDEYHTHYTGTYSVEFEGEFYEGLADVLEDHKLWKGVVDQLGTLRKMIKSKFGVE